MLRLISVTKIEELKIVQFFLKLTKKVTTAVFTLNVKFLKYPKSHQVLWLLLKDNLSPRTFKNRPILFTLHLMQKVFLNKTSFHEMTRDYNFIWSRVRIVEVCGSNKKVFF